MQIAIDGPAGVGKSTIAKKLAHDLDFLYLDTGAMYRAATLIAIKNSIPFDKTEEIIKVLNKKPYKQEGQKFFLGEKEITKEIREKQVSQNVSKIAAKKEIRDYFTKLQQSIAKKQDIVMDGRDIATVVLPNADYKFFLTASPKVRAQRRAKDLNITDKKSLAELEENILKRDKIDSTRENSPLKKAEDAQLIITDQLNIQEVLDKLKKIILCSMY